MSKEPRALVFLFNGTEPDTITIRNMVSMLAAGCTIVVENCEYYSFNSADLAKLSLKMAVNSVNTTESKEELTAEEQALIFIGNEFKEELSDYKPELFLSKLLQRIAELRTSSDSEYAKAFMNALFILSQKDLNISQSLLRKYRLNEKKILMIKQVYNLIKSQ